MSCLQKKEIDAGDRFTPDVSDAVVCGCFFKWAFLKISQILPENSFVGVSFLIKLQAYTPTQVFFL